MLKAIKTLTEAQVLPERSDISYRRIKKDGSVLKRPYFNNLVAVEDSPDSILAFWDKDGRAMLVEYDSKGAFKREAV